MRTTVLIPLHASARWLPVVTGTIERLAPSARLLVSDATGLDDTLDRLRERFGARAGIEWVGQRPLARGWVAHCNDLVERSTTEFVMWMPHDDETDGDWVTLGEQALDANPGAVLALGRLRSLERDAEGTEDRALPSHIVLDAHVPFLAPDAASRATEALDVCLRGNTSLLGAAFRGVVRREAAVPLPDTGDDGAWADILWAISMLTVGAYAATDAVYWKRWHVANTHSTWRDPRRDPSFRAQVLPDALHALAPVVRAQVLAAAWAADASAQSRQVGRLRRRLGSERRALVALRRSFETSASWRLTVPLRAAARLTGRTQG